MCSIKPFSPELISIVLDDVIWYVNTGERLVRSMDLAGCESIAMAGTSVEALKASIMWSFYMYAQAVWWASEEQTEMDGKQFEQGDVVLIKRRSHMNEVGTVIALPPGKSELYSVQLGDRRAWLFEGKELERMKVEG